MQPEAMPAQLDVSAVAETEVADGIVRIDLVLAAPDDVHAHLEAIVAARVGHIVETLERREVVQLGRVAAGADAADIARGENDLRHGGGGVADIDAWNSHLLGEVRIDIDGIEDQAPAVQAETQLVQPAGAERVGIVQGKALRADQPGAVAGGGAGVAVGQRGRQKLLRTLEAVAREKLVLLRDALVHFHVELIVLALESGVVQKVVDDLPGGGALPGDIRRRVQLVDDVLADGIVARSRNAVVGKRLLRERIVDGPVKLREISRPHQVRGHAGGDRSAHCARAIPGSP